MPSTSDCHKRDLLGARERPASSQNVLLKAFDLGDARVAESKELSFAFAKRSTNRQHRPGREMCFPHVVALSVIQKSPDLALRPSKRVTALGFGDRGFARAAGRSAPDVD